MAEFGLLIDYHFCTGCRSCEVACQQEHNHPAGQSGIRVTEYVMDTPAGLSIDNLPFPTALCDLCAMRTHRGELPACVKHCQADCMQYGSIADLAEAIKRKPRTVLFRPR